MNCRVCWLHFLLTSICMNQDIFRNLVWTFMTSCSSLTDATSNFLGQVFLSDQDNISSLSLGKGTDTFSSSFVFRLPLITLRASRFCSIRNTLFFCSSVFLCSSNCRLWSRLAALRQTTFNLLELWRSFSVHFFTVFSGFLFGLQ